MIVGIWDYRKAVFQRTVLENPYVVHKPHMKQAEVLALVDVKEVLYGGAAGGGKTDFLLMAALQYVEDPLYSALIIQRTFTNMKKSGALMTRAREWLHDNEGARWEDGSKTWHFPSGAKLSFGFINDANDKYSYKSSDYMFIAFEELTEFLEEDYTYLFSRLRKPADYPIPLRMRGATNPGGRGHAFVKRRWGLNDKGEQTAAGKATGRVFIQAFAKDNPSLDQESYKENLSELTHRERKYLDEGSWSDFTGEHFRPGAWPRYTDLGNLFSIPQGAGRQLIGSQEVTVLVAVDFAISEKNTADHTCFGAGGLLPDGRLFMLDVLNERIRLEDGPRRLDQFCARWNPVVVAGDDDNLSLAIYNECRRHRRIPEIRRMPIKSRNKLLRAHDAIIMGENGRIYLPVVTEEEERGDKPHWLQPYCDQLLSFTGADKAEDDMADVTGLLATLARSLRGGAVQRSGGDHGVFNLTEPRSEW